MISFSDNGKIKINSYPEFDDNNWVRIRGWDDYYVHPSGFVKSIKTTTHARQRTQTTIEKVLSMFTIRGYASVNLVDTEDNRVSVRVHRLVAEAFIPKVEGKFHVNHIDGKKWNPNINNLEWCTPSENELHSYRVLGKKPRGKGKTV